MTSKWTPKYFEGRDTYEWRLMNRAGFVGGCFV
jgi:hypothetical protein